MIATAAAAADGGSGVDPIFDGIPPAEAKQLRSRSVMIWAIREEDASIIYHYFVSDDEHLHWIVDSSLLMTS